MRLIKVLFIISLINLGIFIVISLLPKPTPNTPSNLSSETVPTTDARCIITIDNQRYDVVTFKNIHPGGDIFKCNTDMSSIFHQQHNQRFLDKIAKYKI